MISLPDLKLRVDESFKKINDPVYIQSVLNKHPTVFTKTIWSKDLAYSLIPLDLECLGFKGSKYLTKIPPKTSNMHVHKLIDDMIREVVVHDTAGQHVMTDYLYRDGDLGFELSLDLNNMAESLTEVVYEDGKVISSLRVNDDKEFWYHEYVYVDNRIKQIITRQYNSDSGKHVGVSHVDYIDNVVANIYYHYLGVKYNLYTYR